MRIELRAEIDVHNYEVAIEADQSVTWDSLRDIGTRALDDVVKARNRANFEG